MVGKINASPYLRSVATPQARDVDHRRGSARTASYEAYR